MKDKKSLISKLLIGGGLLALICGIFCFFGSAGKASIDTHAAIGTITATMGNLFAFMFGSGAIIDYNGKEMPITDIPGLKEKAVGGTTALFAIEMVIIVLAVILLIGIFAKKLQKKQITILGCAVCVLALVAVILAFLSKKMVLDAYPLIKDELQAEGFKTHLGSAGISYGVLGIVGILATGAGLFIGKDEAVAA